MVGEPQCSQDFEDCIKNSISIDRDEDVLREDAVNDLRHPGGEEVDGDDEQHPRRLPTHVGLF